MRDLDEERLRKNEGVFAEEHDEGREAGCDPAEDRCAPDEDAHDPYDSRNIPGTPDDVSYSLGEDAPDPADEEIDTRDEPGYQPGRGMPLPQGAAFDGVTSGEHRATQAAWMAGDSDGAAVPDSALETAPSSVDAANVRAAGVTSAPAPGDAVDHEDIGDIDSLSEPDERDMWRQQRALIDEDEREGYNLQGIPDDEVEDVMAAMGDDAAEANPELPEGTSATGAASPLEPAHGGFPERGE